MKEIDQVVAALESQDYREAAKLLKKLQKESPQNPWVQFYIGRWYEATDKLASAEKVYRKLLKTTTNPKVIDQARQGVKRLEAIEQQRRQNAIADAKTNPRNCEPGVLILEPIAPEDKPEAAKTLARILKTDAYSARMQLQSKGWRLYKTGEMGELGVYGQEMRSANIPVFWVSLTDLEKLHVFRVCYVQSLYPQLGVVCLDESDRLGMLNLNWSEVSHRVEGLLPLFAETMDYDPRRSRGDRFRHKEVTQDYAKIYDLHLPGRHSIIRFCDVTLDFNQGIQLAKVENKQTSRLQWNSLLDRFNQNLDNIPVSSEFTAFAETVLDYTQLLSRIKSYIDLERQSETPWDPAFQLYSGLVFLKWSQH